MHLIRGGKLSDGELAELRNAILVAAWGEKGRELLARAQEEVASLPAFRLLEESSLTEDDLIACQVLIASVACRVLSDPTLLDRLAALELPA
ncbi:hypothetical protein [Candidatus Solincola tengchongensis]|uniref:hypothetical protein n=1 Tax=Candidatus Solincola tengchongensis TaxID=2900693 RepID=UPI00257B1632|nr:hypothetical protein [Candidatus Solincola tengchongensis]